MGKAPIERLAPGLQRTEAPPPSCVPDAVQRECVSANGAPLVRDRSTLGRSIPDWR
jgi:hypothetical protein